VAVIGSGVAGLTAAYVLSGRDRVTLYEADARLGGHAHTHFVDDDGQTLGVDSAFLVHNDRTYPTLCRLFSELCVATQESEMSMSVRADDIGLEYAGALGVRGLFACRQSLRPRYLLMLGEIVRFHRAADRLLRAAGARWRREAYAIQRHAGEAQGVITNFNALTPVQQQQLITFLKSL